VLSVESYTLVTFYTPSTSETAKYGFDLKSTFSRPDQSTIVYHEDVDKKWIEMDGMKFTIDGSIKGSKHIASMEYYMDLLSEWIENGATVRSVIQPVCRGSAILPPPSGCYRSAIPPPPTSHFLAAVEISDPISILSTSGCCRTITPLWLSYFSRSHLHLVFTGCYRVRDPTSTYSLLIVAESLILHLQRTQHLQRRSPLPL
jgi:hypothetical protein